jgi:acyl carrier protein
MHSIELVRGCAKSLHLLDEAGALVQLDSMSVVDLVTAIETAAGIEIGAEHLRAEVFVSLESVAALVDQLA